jgi:hypothetical protein
LYIPLVSGGLSTIWPGRKSENHSTFSYILFEGEVN